MQNTQHPDDAAVDALATAMKAKLAKQRAKGYGGWDTDCTQQRLSDMLRTHVEKGDPVDVANFCAFLLARGEAIAAAQQASDPYAVLVFERGEEGPFDRKPVKPGSVQHLHAKRDPHYDYIELYTHPTQQRMDAEHWAELYRLREEGKRSDGTPWQKVAAQERALRDDMQRAISNLPRYTYGYKADEWGMNNCLQTYQDNTGKFLMRDEVLAALAAQAKQGGAA